MKKLSLITLITALILTMSVSLSAAEKKKMSYGFKGGLNIASTNDLDFGAFKVKVNNYRGFTAGLFLSYPLIGQISFRSELSYTKKGYKLDEVARTDENGQVLYYFTPEEHFSYLEIPLLIEYRVWPDEVMFDFFAGPSLSLLLDSKSNFGNLQFDPGIFESTTNYNNTIDLGLVFGGRIGFKLGKPILFLEGKYTMSLTNVLKDSNISKKHKVLTFSSGLTF